MALFTLVLDLMAKRAVFIAPFSLASVCRQIIRTMDPGAELSQVALVAPGLPMALFTFNGTEPGVPAVFLFEETDRFMGGWFY